MGVKLIIVAKAAYTYALLIKQLLHPAPAAKTQATAKAHASREADA
jgi:hypothetical protein